MRPSPFGPPAEAEKDVRVCLALVELNAHRLGGHWHDNLMALTRAARAGGMPVSVAALNGVAPSTRTALQVEGVAVYDRPSPPDLASWALVAAGQVFRSLSARTQRIAPSFRFPHQLTLVSRCLMEAASLRITARSLQPSSSLATVLLTASEGLHEAAAALSSVPHLRIVHEVYTTEDAVLRWIGGLFHDAGRRLLVICTTQGVEDDFRRRFPHLRSVIHPFAVLDPASYISEDERGAARSSFGFGDGDTVAAVVGGWWWYKDMNTVVRAIARMNRRTIHLIVAGAPIDRAALKRLDRSTAMLVTLARELEPQELRRVYAASDFTIVSRLPGVTKESGLVMDAFRYGIPLVISNHDPMLTGLLQEMSCVRIFPAGDDAGLATTIDDLAAHPPTRPLPEDATRLGMMTAAEAIRLFTDLQAVLE